MDHDTSAAFELQQKYKHFRILVIGRANAGKTTLLKQVCNTTEELCIYNEEKKSLVCFHSDNSNPQANFQRVITVGANWRCNHHLRVLNVYIPIDFVDQHGIHDIHCLFAFANNLQFIFHDSPGFEKGDGTQLKEVQDFIKQHAKATDVEDQLHAIWYDFAS